MLCLLEFECTLAGLVQMLENARLLTITNTLCVFHVETTWKHRFNVGCTWCVCTKIILFCYFFNPLSANPTKWSNTLKQFLGSLPTNCFSVFDLFVELALKGIILPCIMLKNGQKYFKNLFNF